MEIKLEVWDSPNSAGVVIDAIRCCKLALDNGLSGALIEPSSYFKKSPPVQYTDDEARRLTEEFIAKYGWKHTGARKSAPVKVAARRPERPRPAVKPTSPRATGRVVRKKK
jgi:myo-inositol-1-phosphate synthase